MNQNACAAAKEEARQNAETAHTADETVRIMSEIEEKTRRLEKLAMANLDRAVDYVQEQVVGKD